MLAPLLFSLAPQCPPHFFHSRIATELDITRHALEAACWLQLGCWSNNIANAHFISGAFNRRVLRSCLLPQCSHPPYWPGYQRRLANCDWMPASYTSIQPSYPRRHPTFWASELHRSGATLPLARRAMEPGHLVHSSLISPSSAKALHLEWRHTFVPAAQQLISWPDNNNIVRRIGRIINGMRSGRATPQDSAFSSPTPAPTHPKWPSQEEPGSGSTASALMSDVCATVFANEVWPPLRPVSVAQKNKRSTMLSSTVQSIDLLMDCIAWRFCTMRQSNGCSTPASSSSAAKQWFEELAEKIKKNLTRNKTICSFVFLNKKIT